MGRRAPLPSPVNTADDDESYASDTAGGDLYFFSNRPGGKGRFDLYMCPFKDGKPTAKPSTWIPEHGVPTNGTRSSPPTEAISSSAPPGREDRAGTTSISPSRARTAHGGRPSNLGEEVNSPGSENRPYVTRDGKYFFFTSTRNGSRDTFWVRAEYLDRFRK